jgi:hypothetical protein
MKNSEEQMKNCGICKKDFAEGLMEIKHGDLTMFWCRKQWNIWQFDMFYDSDDMFPVLIPDTCPNEE